MLDVCFRPQPVSRRFNQVAPELTFAVRVTAPIPAWDLAYAALLVMCHGVRGTRLAESASLTAGSNRLPREPSAREWQTGPRAQGCEVRIVLAGPRDEGAPEHR
ncbi:hypothetical protein GCM10009121_11560 [Rhodanobacter soli]